MQTLIKRIRTFLNMNQTEFAEQLNVTFQTVNRWENGHTIPNRLAQSSIYELCMARSVPVYEMTLQRIAGAAKAIKLEAGRVILYHASKEGIEGAIEPKSCKRCDFGNGFYMGTEPSQTLTLLCDYEKSKFYIVSLNMDELVNIEIHNDIDWAMLVAYHRGRLEKVKGTAFYNKFRDITANNDLIIGNIVNDCMFFVMDNFFIGNITDAALINSLSFLQFGKQYVAVSQKGCDAVRIEAEVYLSYLERMFMKEIAEENQTRRISLANDICKNYRREGMFFDEILDEAKIGGKQ